MPGTTDADEITISLPSDKALVLFELLNRWEDDEQVMPPQNEAEQIGIAANIIHNPHPPLTLQTHSPQRSDRGMKKPQRVRTRTVAAASVAGLVATLVATVAVPSSADPVLVPIAIRGSVDSGIDLASRAVSVEILPEPALLENLPAGTSVHNSLVPASMVHTSGSDFAVRLDPTDLPEDLVSDTGLVSFLVVVQDAERRVLSSSSASARIVMTDAGLAWTDPLSATVDLGQSTSAKRAPAGVRRQFTALEASSITTKYAPAVKPVVTSLAELTGMRTDCKSGRCAARRGAVLPSLGLSAAEPDDDGEVVGRDDVPPPIIEEPTEVRDNCPNGGAGDVYTTKRRVSTTIGTAYPVGKDTAWMSHSTGSSSEFTGSYGAAFQNGIGLSWKQSNTKTVEVGTGFDWDPKQYNRAFRVEMVYQKVEHYYDRCPSEGDEPYTSHWVPMYYSGGYGEKTGNLPRPDWNTCARIGSTGTWWRSRADGSSYELSYGVDISGVIGIDMSSKRAYNGEAKLAYRVGMAGRRMCGSGGKEPGIASKVIERAPS